MKKLFLFIAQSIFAISLFGQSITEVGGKIIHDLNGSSGISADAIMPLSRTGRVRGDVGVIANGLATNFVYNYIYKIPELPELSANFGGGGGMFIGESVFNVSIVTECAVEYKWDFPLTIGFDVRPRFNLIDDQGLRASVAAVARYRF